MNDESAVPVEVIHPLECMRRKRFPSEKAADSVIYSMRARQQDTERLESFECPHCHQWHLRKLPSSLTR